HDERRQHPHPAKSPRPRLAEHDDALRTPRAGLPEGCDQARPDSGFSTLLRRATLRQDVKPRQGGANYGRSVAVIVAGLVVAVATFRVCTATVGKSGYGSYCNQSSDNHGRNLLHLMLLLIGMSG